MDQFSTEKSYKIKFPYNGRYSERTHKQMFWITENHEATFSLLYDLHELQEMSEETLKCCCIKGLQN